MSSVYTMEEIKEKVYNYVEGVDGDTKIHILPSFAHRLIGGAALKKILPELKKDSFSPLENFAISLLALHLISLDIITLRK